MLSYFLEIEDNTHTHTHKVTYQEKALNFNLEID